MGRKSHIVEIPVTLRFKLSPDASSPKPVEDLVQARISEIKRELNDATHIEDFDLGDPETTRYPQPASDTETGL